MKLFFIGVGEACDSTHGNSSVLVTTRCGRKILLDCGFSVPRYYFRYFPEGDDLDYVWISHFHGDHFLGLPLLFLRLWQMGRTRPLTIVGQEGVEDKVVQALELAFPGFGGKISFPLEFHIVTPGYTSTIGGIDWTTTLTRHSQRNLGLLLDDGEKTMYYSGDGQATNQVQDLVRGCDCIVHESFSLVDTFAYHGSIGSSMELADRAGVAKLLLIHLDRDVRENDKDEIDTLVRRRPGTLLPVAGHSIEF